MHEAYQQSRFPPTTVRERLCKEVGGTMRQIQVWFQNRRQRDQRQHEMWPSAMPVVFVNHPGMPPGIFYPGSNGPMVQYMIPGGMAHAVATPQMVIMQGGQPGVMQPTSDGVQCGFAGFSPAAPAMTVDGMPLVAPAMPLSSTSLAMALAPLGHNDGCTPGGARARVRSTRTCSPQARPRAVFVFPCLLSC